MRCSRETLYERNPRLFDGDGWHLKRAGMLHFTQAHVFRPGAVPLTQIGGAM